MQVLWLRYLTEIDENTCEIPKELLDNPEIGKAVEKLEESAFTEKELLAYDKFWDTISTSRLLLIGAMRRGMKEGHGKGHGEGFGKGFGKRPEGREDKNCPQYEGRRLPPGNHSENNRPDSFGNYRNLTYICIRKRGVPHEALPGG